MREPPAKSKAKVKGKAAIVLPLLAMEKRLLGWAGLGRRHGINCHLISVSIALPLERGEGKSLGHLAADLPTELCAWHKCLRSSYIFIASSGGKYDLNG
jgi:hypothetical protein